MRYEVKDCAHCPFGDMSDAGRGEYCIHPKSGQDKRTPLDIDHNGFAKTCPLRDVQDQYHSMDEIINKMLRVQKEGGVLHEIKPCPFCGYDRIRERYLDEKVLRMRVTELENEVEMLEDDIELLRRDYTATVFGCFILSLMAFTLTILHLAVV